MNISGPIIEPNLSKASWIPNPNPLPILLVAKEIIASLAELLIPLPILSNRINKTAISHLSTSAKSGIDAINPYPMNVKIQYVLYLSEK